MKTAKQRANSVGLTSEPDIKLVNPADHPLVNFPASAVRRRVRVEPPPPPPPVRRTCLYCGWTFDDYTGKPNTLYCKAGCKTMMSEKKRETSVAAWADWKTIPLELAGQVCEMKRLPEIEKLLNEAGYFWRPEVKKWEQKANG